MKNIAFIFARGGSKGLPGKNIKKLDGKPLIQYSIDIAKASPSITDIFVSTDDKLIKNLAIASGIKVIDRPIELARDNSPEWSAWRHAIEWVYRYYGKFDSFISLPATSPLRAVEDVESAIATRIKSDADICISVTPANRNPYFNMVQLNNLDIASLIIESDEQIHHRQDCPNVYDITTVAYVGCPEFILREVSIFKGKVVSIVVPKERAVDIDDIYDFYMAEAIIKFNRGISKDVE